MLVRCILPDWAVASQPGPKVLEGDFSEEKIQSLNEQFYNIYYFPNYPSLHLEGETVDGSQVDTFEWVFVDMDLKETKYASKDAFISSIGALFSLPVSTVVDTGNGVHAYWRVKNLDAASYLKLSRRLTRLLDTDIAVGKILQLMRLPGTINTKKEGSFKLCELLYSDETAVYDCEQMDKALPPLTAEDAAFVQNHYNKTYRIDDDKTKIDEKLPLKFGQLLRENKEVKELWCGSAEDRSKSDYRLGHVMFAHGFTKAEAASVLVNSAKASQRAPVHRKNYALNIVDKIWAFEAEDSSKDGMARSVRDILSRSGDEPNGTRIPCHAYFDSTACGFRLGHVLGLVAGSGVGKTAFSLEMFYAFVKNTPDMVHFFVPLEQPAVEIAERWRNLCGGDTTLYDRVYIMDNHDEKGRFRHLSLDDIRDYVAKFQTDTRKKVGALVIDHIGALKKQTKNGENQGIMDICHQMKSVAVGLNVFLVMQSQAPREKAGIGDLELNKDAAYGTLFFESYCDWLMTLWQPLKRAYSDPNCPSVTAFKFAKIRHKNRRKDQVQEDAIYRLVFDENSEHFRPLTGLEEESATFFNNVCINKRKADRKTEVLTYNSLATEG